MKCPKCNRPAGGLAQRTQSPEVVCSCEGEEEMQELHNADRVHPTEPMTKDEVVVTADIKALFKGRLPEVTDRGIDNLIALLNAHFYNKAVGCLPTIYHNRKDLLSPDEYQAYETVKINLTREFGQEGKV